MSLKSAPQAAPLPVRTLVVLLVLVTASALGVVYAKHQSRKLFVELQGLHKTRDAMDVEWGQLQLEQGALATHGRVEETAGAKLGMLIPEANQVVILHP